MPEKGFSSFEIQTPLENLTLHKPKVQKVPLNGLNPSNFETPTPFYFQTQNTPCFNDLNCNMPMKFSWIFFVK